MALKDYAKPTAEAVGRLADKIIKKRDREVVLVSLARAGIPIGILVRHYIKRNTDMTFPIIPFPSSEDVGLMKMR